MSTAAAQLREAVDLVGLFAEVTSVRQQGSSAKALCPFHEEKTPSMVIDGDRGLYHCFGCQSGGDAITFVQEQFRVDFREALRILGDRAGVDVSSGAGRSASRAGRLADVRRRAASFFQERLKSGPDAARARAWLRRARGCTSERVADWGLGFAPAAGSALVDHLRSARVSDGDMTAAGVAERTAEGLAARWRAGEVMWPVRRPSGEVWGFAAESVGGGWEWPAHGGRAVFGLDWARSAAARRGYALVVKSFHEVAVCREAGVETAVAACSDQLTKQQMEVLGRYVSKVVVASGGSGLVEAAAAGGEGPPDVYLAETPMISGDGSLTDEAELVASAVPLPLAQLRAAAAADREQTAGGSSGGERNTAVRRLLSRYPAGPVRNELAAVASAEAGVPAEWLLPAPGRRSPDLAAV